jgi:hypothetical protein
VAELRPALMQLQFNERELALIVTSQWSLYVSLKVHHTSFLLLLLLRLLRSLTTPLQPAMLLLSFFVWCISPGAVMNEGRLPHCLIYLGLSSTKY